MYADQVASSNKRSLRERLNGESEDGRTRQNNNKRQRQNDSKWKHDLYEDDEKPQISKREPRVGSGDLRLKLQKKGRQQTIRNGKRSLGGGSQDLRDKLSGIMHPQPANSDLPKAKPVKEVSNVTRRSVQGEVVPPETKTDFSIAPSRKKLQKKGATVDGFLQSLGLEKYQITFRAEEIDMTALLHMTDDDLKALGVPMGPRKKILLALDSRD